MNKQSTSAKTLMLLQMLKFINLEISYRSCRSGPCLASSGPVQSVRVIQD